MMNLVSDQGERHTQPDSGFPNQDPVTFSEQSKHAATTWNLYADETRDTQILQLKYPLWLCKTLNYEPSLSRGEGI